MTLSELETFPVTFLSNKRNIKFRRSLEMKRKFFALGLAAALSLSILSGCGGNTANSGSSTPSGNSARLPAARSIS